ncbi:MAG: hypothetical protein KAR18_09980 [Spirochaetes bacterium]|nr:hypothetical protein [Spirochaetota bacterium]MCK5095045.1 hypothetical protein [Spirochaetota bacterium]
MKAITVFLLIILLPIASFLFAEDMDDHPLTRVDPGFNYTLDQSARLIVTADGAWYIYWYSKSNTALKIGGSGYSLEWELLSHEEEYRAGPDPAGYILLNR